jgi:translation initiation factor 2-alpha kinase 3
LGASDSQDNSLLQPSSAPASTTESSPSFKEDFTCLAQLGRGAFGEVFHCRDHSDGKEYALKAVRFKSGRKDAETHAKREVEMLAAVNHLNVMRYHRHWIEFDQDPNTKDAYLSKASTSISELPKPQIIASSPSIGLKSELLPGLIELSTEISCSYDCDSCEYSGVIFEGSRDEDVHVKAETSSPFSAVLFEKPSEGTDFVRCISSGKAPTHDCQTVTENIGHTSDDMATLYIQVELCQQETLQDWISSRNAKVANRDDEQIARAATNIFYQCACALAHLHDRSLAHRDVKPSNIFFSQDGSVRLGDFGLAKKISRDMESADSIRKSPQVCSCEGQRGKKNACAVGTPSYASPEQRLGDIVDVSTDVYSLGLVLMELICPVKTQMERAAMLQRLRDGREVPSAKYLRPKCRKLARLALWMTEPEPSQRPSAKEIIRFTRSIRYRNSSCGSSLAMSPKGKTCKFGGNVPTPTYITAASGSGHRPSGGLALSGGRGRWLRRRCLHRSSQQATRATQCRERTSDAHHNSEEQRILTGVRDP